MAICSGEKPQSSSTFFSYLMGCLQSVQILRASRCASTRFTLAVMRNGSTPMLSRREMVAGASLVWSVDSTRWPVSAAFTAISAVSKSRISPTRIMFGSCRRKARRAVAKKLTTVCGACAEHKCLDCTCRRSQL